MSSVTFSARRYSGTSSAPKEVTVQVFADGLLAIAAGDEAALQLTPSQYRWELPVGRAPIRIKLEDGALLEAPFNDAVHELLLARDPGLAKQLWNAERSLKTALTLLSGAAVMVLCVYLYGIPALVSVLHPLVPLSVKDSVGEHVLKILDKVALEPSALTEERKEAVASWAQALATGADLPISPDVSFRKLGEIPNAFALPSRQVVLTDSLIETLSREELEGVIGHELGHLVHDHGMQTVIRGSIISTLVLALFGGGDPDLVQSLAIGLIDATYSQEQETEADLYAAELLHRLGKRPAALADALRKIGREDADDEGSSSRYFSSHPLTSDRIRALEAFRPH